MTRARWRNQLNPPAARRGLATLIAVMALAMMSTSPTLARRPNGSSGQPEGDTYIPPRTPAEAAFERVKLDIAAAVRHFAAPAAQRQTRSDLAAPASVCVSDCGGGGGGGGGIGGGTGGGDSGGTSGTTGPAQTVILEARARRQSTAFWCGPASGQVVINYSRGYVFPNLTGDSSTTNWKTQATIAGWMKTTESSGTLGGNLAAALNRPDAVLKPVPDWSYLYATNADGADMHAKIVTDIGKYAMPLVIAVKPHAVDADYYLPSWPKELPGAKHWITIYGYDGFWDGTDDPQVYYTESAGNGGKSPGPYNVGSLTMWKVNQYNAKTIVW
ncbi:MAG: hypothetical protein ACXWZL_03920 [Mycobacterium sp.]